MSDDIFSAFDSGPSDDDDLFAPFEAESLGDDDPFASGPPFASAGEAEDPFAGLDSPSPGVDDNSDWLSSAGGFGDSPAFSSTAEFEDDESGGFMADGGPLAGVASSGAVFGLMPMQRMVLAFFLFINVLIFSCAILLITGTIRP